MIQSKNQQGSFHDILWEGLLPHDHELIRIKKSFDYSEIEAELRKGYKDSGEGGRPAFPPLLLFLMLFLEYYDNLSDYEVSERTRYNALYRYFVGLSLEETVPDHATLSVFRKRIGEKRFREVFNRFVGELKKQQLVSHRVKIVDATHVEADARVRSRVGMIRQAKRRILARMKQEDGARQEAVVGRWYPGFAVGEEGDEGSLSEGLSEEERGSCGKGETERLGEEVEGLQALISVAKEEFSGEAKREAEAIEALLFHAPGPVMSLTDPEARIGHKTKEKSFHGYKIHTVTNESEIVTTVETLPGNVNEGGDLPRLLKEEAARGLPGEVVLADGLYDGGENRAAIRHDLDLQMIEVIPWDKRTVQVESFQLDAETDRLRCGQGCEAIAGSPREDGRLFYFSKADCGGCLERERCPSFSKREGRARVFLSKDRELQKSHPWSSEKRRLVYRHRTIVERTYGKAKHWHGLGHARYRGRGRVAVQAFLTFLVLNAKKALRILEGRCPIRPENLAAFGYG